MEQMKRYAVYYAPEPGPFADAAAAWLGWDPVAGAPVLQPEGLHDLTAEPRKYGFHGTIKPPFRLADGADYTALQSATERLAQALTPVTLPGLRYLDMEGFLALVPQGDTRPLLDLAARVVAELDPLRAPLTEAEIARRRPERLNARQRDLLATYGYPHVMEEFRFHLTLSGRLTPDQHAALLPRAQAHFAPHLPQPFRLAALTLFGEAQDGRFHQLHRYPLG